MRLLWENHEKKTENFPQFSQNENTFVKMGELFAHFDKKYSHFEKIGRNFSVFFSKFSYDFCQCKNVLQSYPPNTYYISLNSAMFSSFINNPSKIQYKWVNMQKIFFHAYGLLPFRPNKKMKWFSWHTIFSNCFVFILKVSMSWIQICYYCASIIFLGAQKSTCASWEPFLYFFWALHLILATFFQQYKKIIKGVLVHECWFMKNLVYLLLDLYKLNNIETSCFFNLSYLHTW